MSFDVIQLRHYLNCLYQQYHHKDFLASDPLEFVHRYSDPWDMEAVALMSALLAYGNVRQIRRSVAGILQLIHTLEESPQAFVKKIVSSPPFFKKSRTHFKNFVHRFNTGEDVLRLFLLLGQSWEQSGSLGAFFLEGLSHEHQHIEVALNHLIQRWKLWSQKLSAPTNLSFKFLLTAPQDGSTCKRWCMFLRWMGRRDSLDVGLWTEKTIDSQNSLQIYRKYKNTFPKNKFLHPYQLLIPLDTHAGRISQFLGLTSRKTQDWKMSLEVTNSLKQLNNNDPVRYDFAITRLGILDLCQKKYRVEICQKCSLLPACHFAKQCGKH